MQLSRSQILPDQTSISSESEEDDGIEDTNGTTECWTNGSSLEDDFFNWTLLNDELAENERGLTAVEMLGEDFEREAANNGVYMSSFLITLILM